MDLAWTFPIFSRVRRNAPRAFRRAREICFPCSARFRRLCGPETQVQQPLPSLHWVGRLLPGLRLPALAPSRKQLSDAVSNGVVEKLRHFVDAPGQLYHVPGQDLEFFAQTTATTASSTRATRSPPQLQIIWTWHANVATTPASSRDGEAPSPHPLPISAS